VALSYDNQGRVTGYTDASGTVATTSYNIDARPSSTHDGKASVCPTYDSATETRKMRSTVVHRLGSTAFSMRRRSLEDGCSSLADVPGSERTQDQWAAS
jgi:YD repeat-containing protein